MQVKGVMLLILILQLNGIRAQVAEKQDSLAMRLQNESMKKKSEALEKASRLGWAVRIDSSDGSSSELIELENGFPVYYTTNNAVAAKSISTQTLHTGGSLGLNLNGSGMVIGMWDGGSIRLTHQEFGGRAVQADGVNSLLGHATHVAGTLIASGVVPTVKGMAPQANLRAYDWNSDNSEMEQAAMNGMLVSNHSYGQVCGWAYGKWSTNTIDEWHWFGFPSFSTSEDVSFGLYNFKAAVWDNMMYKYPQYLIVKSVGNDRGEGPDLPVTHKAMTNLGGWSVSTLVRPKDGGLLGYDCIPTYGVAKNLLAVGSVEDIPNGYQSPTDVVISPFSSFGPTDDGRIKPDIVANGSILTSSFSNSNTSYSTSSGTSMASPGVAGSLLLLQEYHKRLYGNFMQSATLKALAIHTADEAGLTPGPDYMYGFGLMNSKNAALAIQDTQNFRMIEAVLNQGDTLFYNLFSDGITPLKVTLCWNDTSGLITSILNDRTPRIVNDLDIRLLNAQCNVTFFPWKLNPELPAAPATMGDNIVDNVEMIGDLVLPAGTYRVRITHKNSLMHGKQRFSLIIEGKNPPPSQEIEVLTAIDTSLNLPSALSNMGTSLLNANTNVLASLNGNTLSLQGIESGKDTVKLVTCFPGICAICDTFKVIVDVKSCADNVSLNTSAPIVEAVAACDDASGMLYYIDPVTKSTILAINDNGNAFFPQSVILDEDESYNYEYSGVSGNAILMKRTITVNAPGYYPINGGLQLKFFYHPSEKDLLETYFPYGRWFKFSGSKAQTVEALQNGSIEALIFNNVTEDSVGEYQYAILDSIKSFSTFGFIGYQSESFLPVTWVSFTGKETNEGIQLDWETASEKNNRGFSIERSTDGVSYKEIAFVDGNGTTSLPKQYQFMDKNVLKGILYYRLKQIDFDGKFEYSNIIQVEVKNNKGIIISRMPFSDTYFIQGKERGEVLSVWDLQGIQLLKSQENFLDFSRFQEGVYFVSTSYEVVKIVLTR